MENLNVRFVTNSIIEGKPISHYVVTTNDSYLATVYFNCFTHECEVKDMVDKDFIVANIQHAVAKFQVDSILKMYSDSEDLVPPPDFNLLGF